MTIQRIHLLLLVFLFISSSVFSQKSPAWDDTESKNWPAEARQVNIQSSADGKTQKAYFYKSPGAAPRPLIVSLHTWSGNYQQKDTLVQFCIRRGYHYIHPDFRGPNTTREALGSDLVVSDIDDAISYSIANASVDPDNIHVIGVSGGGHATVLTYMKSRHDIRSFSAYVGIYNLIDWYHESMGRKNKYGLDILEATSGGSKKLNTEEAEKRSPFFMDTPVEKRSNSKLNLYAGIHDGYTGSVPVTHTLQLYNKVVRDFQPDAKATLIPDEYIHTMVKTRSLPGFEDAGTYLDRKIIYQNNYKHLVNVTIFEGTHEMPPGDVLHHVPSRQILAIGDSNGAAHGGWVDQLQKLRPQDVLINTCVSGNTIGFDNLDKEALNTLKNLDRYLAQPKGTTDAIVIMLGTNDCKAVFNDRSKEIPANLEKLILQIKARIAASPASGKPEIFIVSPPPFANDEKLEPKYHGGAARVAKLTEEFQKTAKKTQVNFINAHPVLNAVFPYISADGVHLSSEGQVILARIINGHLQK